MGSTPSSLRSSQATEKRKADRRQLSDYFPQSSFILGLSHQHIHLVNASDKEMVIMSRIVRSHCTVVKEGWVKNITYAFKVKKINKTNMIRLMSTLLFTLDQAGWDPLAPVEMGNVGKKTLTTIYFSKRPRISASYKSLRSQLSMLGTSADREVSCFCLELYQQSVLLFHYVPNTILAELVTTANSSQGVVGVSRAVLSVIADYNSSTYPLLGPKVCRGAERWVKLVMGKEGQLDDELENSIIACLTTFGYKLSIPINWDMSTRMFFFILDQEDTNEVRQESKSVAGVGTKDFLSTYRPIIKRSKSSFFRSFDNKTELKKRLKSKLQRRIGRDSLIMFNKPAWYQQTSTDIGTDFDQQEESHCGGLC